MTCITHRTEKRMKWAATRAAHVEPAASKAPPEDENTLAAQMLAFERAGPNKSKLPSSLIICHNVGLNEMVYDALTEPMTSRQIAAKIGKKVNSVSSAVSALAAQGKTQRLEKTGHTYKWGRVPEVVET